MTDTQFFSPLRRFSASELAELTGARLRNSHHADVQISTIAPASLGGDGSIVYVEGRKNVGLLKGLRAAAVFCTEDVADEVPADVAVLITPKPQQAFAKVGRTLYPQSSRPDPIMLGDGISPQALIGAGAQIEDGAIIEAGAVVGAGAQVGSGTVVAPTAVIGAGTRIGRDGYVGPGATVLSALVGDRVILHPGVRIGQDGFGFVGGQRGLEKVPQIGRVIIQDDVEIGASTCVDRGTMADTVIGEGTKIDNLVQIAHNVRIGRHCAIAAQCGLSGSVTLGDFVMLGGSVGIVDHVTVGSGAQLAARSGVMHDIPAGERWGGAPAQPMRDFFREVNAIRNLVKARTRKDPND